MFAAEALPNMARHFSNYLESHSQRHHHTPPARPCGYFELPSSGTCNHVHDNSKSSESCNVKMMSDKPSRGYVTLRVNEFRNPSCVPEKLKEELIFTREMPSKVKKKWMVQGKNMGSHVSSLEGMAFIDHFDTLLEPGLRLRSVLVEELERKNEETTLIFCPSSTFQEEENHSDEDDHFCWSLNGNGDPRPVPMCSFRPSWFTPPKVLTPEAFIMRSTKIIYFYRLHFD
ncbi:hypothetical protein SK128_017196 [Halocaridina rubra]|uniref:Uncharacterized protein n=1 Tax=Halocaridina rubra TaxID=373956 RepID=A0AAN9A286_HALRR